MNFHIETPFLMTIFGKVSVGKSSFIKWLMQYIYKQYDYPLVITTTKFNGGYDYLPDKCVVSQYSDDLIQKLMSHHIKAINDKKPKKCILILDDIIGNIKFSDKVLESLFTTFRHYFISIIVTTQYPKKVPPYIRNNTQYAVFFEQQSGMSQKALFEEYSPPNMSKKQFDDTLKWCGNKGHVILLNMKASQNEAQNKFIQIQFPAQDDVKINLFTSLKKTNF